SLCALSMSAPPTHNVSPSSPTRRSSDLWTIQRSQAAGTNDRHDLARRQHTRIRLRDPQRIGRGGRRDGAAERCHECIENALRVRSEEHTSELQSPDHLVCRLLLEKKKQR